MTEAPEKAKNAPSRDYYNPNVSFALIFGAFVVMLFFRADELFGAVGLREYYMTGSIVAVVIATICILGLMGAWRILDPITAGIFSVLIMVMALIFNDICFILIPVGWMAVAFIPLLPPVVLIAGAAFTLIAWILVEWFKVTVIVPSLLKSLTIFMLTASPFLLLGIGASHSAFEPVRREQFNNHHYFLSLHRGWLADSDWLRLYECNHLAMACEQVHRKELGHDVSLKYTDIQLIPDAAAGTISIVVDGEVLYTHPVSP